VDFPALLVATPGLNLARIGTPDKFGKKGGFVLKVSSLTGFPTSTDFSLLQPPLGAGLTIVDSALLGIGAAGAFVVNEATSMGALDTVISHSGAGGSYVSTVEWPLVLEYRPRDGNIYHMYIAGVPVERFNDIAKSVFLSEFLYDPAQPVSFADVTGSTLDQIRLKFSSPAVGLGVAPNPLTVAHHHNMEQLQQQSHDFITSVEVPSRYQPRERLSFSFSPASSRSYVSFVGGAYVPVVTDADIVRFRTDMTPVVNPLTYQP
jgi:hypothetical protein